MQPNFYNQNNELPLSLALNQHDIIWKDSVLGRINSLNSQVWLQQLDNRQRTSDYAWRVCDLWLPNEDSQITYFRAYDYFGQQINATFGVNFDSAPRIGGVRFTYPPEKQHYHIPINNQFVTPNTGGYSVQVLDLNYPSEVLHFGLFKNVDNVPHRALVISFRLFKINEFYPNDMTGVPR